MAANGNKTNGSTEFHPRMLINGEVGFELCDDFSHVMSGVLTEGWE